MQLEQKEKVLEESISESEKRLQKCMQKQELESSLRLQEEQREPLLQAAGKAEEERKKNPELQRKAEELEGEIRKIRERMERILRIETLGQKAEKLGEELEKVQKKCQEHTAQKEQLQRELDRFGASEREILRTACKSAGTGRPAGICKRCIWHEDEKRSCTDRKNEAVAGRTG